MNRQRLTALVLASCLLALAGATSGPAAPGDQPGAKDSHNDLYGDPLPAGALARMGTVRFRHGGDLYFVACLPKGQLLTAGNDRTARLWDLASGKETRRFTLPPPPAVADDFGGFRGGSTLARTTPLAVSPNGTTLTAADGKEVIRFWDLTSGKELEPIKGMKNAAAALALAPDDKTVAVVAADGSVTAWDVGSGKEGRQFAAASVQAPADGGAGGFGSSLRRGLLSPSV